jgi:serine/threonine-protein kinase
MPKSGPKRLGKYELLEVVGEGGMGVVYKAVDPEIGRLVGIKMMTGQVISDPRHLKRFYREAQSAGKLRHPNIVTIYDLGVEEAIPYMVMEFLEGESLDALIRCGRGISLEEKLNIVIQACNALAYAHEQEIVHRDIKPGNVMLLKDGTVKLVDFGIARIGREHITRTGQLLGSIQYMSPEQIQDSPVDLRTDIFSTGVMLYQLLTYQLPFEGKDAGETLLKIIHDPPPPLGRFLSAYPPELDDIVQRVLAKNPDERYQTATDLAFDLSHVQERLKRERVSEYLEAVEVSVAEGQWVKAKDQLVQLLKIDRQNVRAGDLLREVQQQIQKQQRSERIRDLQSQAEQAIAGDRWGEALRYLDSAVGLDETNAQLRELRDAVREKKKRTDQMSELLARAKSAFDTEDLEDALATVKQALAVDSESRDARDLHAVIAKELAERAKLKQIQTLVEEARKQISSRHFTAALEFLRKAEALDPNAPGVSDFIALASTGQQEQRRRKELEEVSAGIEEALNANDYRLACAKAAEALERFPNERGLLKLKEMADKEREATEKRIYVEGQISLARRLLEEKKSAEALLPLDQALARYPNEFVLQSMHSLIRETVERERAEQFEAQIIQLAKDAIRRKAYSEAIEVLQAAQQQTLASEFDDLLQFAQEEAASFAARNKIDAAAKEAHRLTSAGEFEPAIELLDGVLKEADDEELRIVLADARRQLEEFNAGLQEVLATARRLVHMDRHGEAAKFLEAQALRYNRSPEIVGLLQQVNQERRRVEAFSTVKEHAREALADSDFEGARALLEKYRAEFGDGLDAQLLQREIDVKQGDAARVAVGQALQDSRVLLIVRCYQEALDILDRVSRAAAWVPDMRQAYDFARANAMAGLERERLSNERYELMKQRVAEAGDQATLSNSQGVAPPSSTPVARPEQETELANVAQLESVLGEVTLIAQHYPGDRKIQSAVGDIRHRLTLQIAALRQTDGACAVEGTNHQAYAKGVPQEPPTPSGTALPARARPDAEAGRPGALAEKLPALTAVSGLEATMLRTSAAALSPATPAQSEAPLPGIPPERLKLRTEAQKCLADAQQAFAKSQWEEGSELLKRAVQIANHDDAIREQAIAIILATSESALQTRWETVAPLLGLAAELCPGSPLLPILKGKIENRKREQIIERCVADAQAARSAGDLQAGLVAIERGLAAYPNAPSLLRLKQDIESRIQDEQRHRKHQEGGESARQREAGRTQQNQLQAETKAVGQDPQAETTSTPAPPESDPFGKETRFFPTEEPAPATPGSLNVQPRLTSARNKEIKPHASLLPSALYNPLALFAGVLFLVILGYFSWRITRALTSSTVPVQIDTSPEGASVLEQRTGQKCITPHCVFKLSPGQHTVEANLKGYETVTRTVWVHARGSNAILIQMPSRPTEVPGKPSEPEKPAHLKILGAPAGARVYQDGAQIGRIGRQGTFSADLPAGDHQIKVSAGHRDGPLVFRHFPAGGAVELHKADVEFPPIAANAPLVPPAEELAWQKVRSTTSPADVEGFLKRYPSGVFRFEAAAKLEDLYWAKANERPSLTSLRNYLHRYPGGRYADSAQREIAKIDFETVRNSTDTAVLEAFLKDYPSGNYHDQVTRRLDDLSWERTGRGRDLKGVLAYLERFPNGSHIEEAQKSKSQLTRLVERDAEPTSRPTAAALPPIDERKAVLNLLELYRKAYEDRNLQELKKIWPGMTQQQLRSLSDFFRTATSVNLTYSVLGEPEVTGDQAVVKLTQSLTYVVGGRSERPRPATMIVKLRKPGLAQPGTAWQIDSIR